MENTQLRPFAGQLQASKGISAPLAAGLSIRIVRKYLYIDEPFG